MKTIYLSSAYLAPVEYYSKLKAYDKIYIEQHDHYVKQTYRNRCNIAGPEGVLSLSVPIIRPDTPKCAMKDIRISDHGNWRHLHWNAIESAYNNTPFFEYYKDDLRPFYENKYTFLADFNEELRCKICELMDISPVVEHTASYHTDFLPDEADYREVIHPKKDYTEVDKDFLPKPYYQVFESRHGFFPKLSVIDLLFNMGRERGVVL